ncbi:FAD-dependent oxidoreductase [Denitromonas sp. IR12]|uniref:FAD-dependent oxidoreductase n=1 Tax=Denitromonas iodatirespirans TaxID=2795389 RepID=A0A944DCL0_DENI1|nr:FAD-dependent oxidoreductase [Denitromonas iodatirespirans]
MVIVGAGQSGLQVAESLRSEGYDGPILLVGDEPCLPYHRPPLSKAYLAGEADEAQLTIRAPAALAKKQIECVTGVSVVAIDREARAVHLSDGRTQAYAGLVLATGSRARPLPVPGADLAGVFALRTLDDTRRIATALEAARTVVVIGGGFIGLEFAAVAAKQGKQVTVLEAADRLMARVVAPPVSDFYARLHRDHGVAVELGAQVAGLDGVAGRVSAVSTADGRRFAADLVIVGIGIVPNTELAEAAGLTCERGIVVDECARTTDTQIVASGDCTARRLPGGALLRLESVQNAVEQGKSAAAALMGRERPFAAAPWFWSDQYDVKLQMVGLSAGYDEVVIRGEVEARRFSVFYFRAGALIAIDAINEAGVHMLGRKLLDKGHRLAPEQARDPHFELASALT